MAKITPRSLLGSPSVGGAVSAATGRTGSNTLKKYYKCQYSTHDTAAEFPRFNFDFMYRSITIKYFLEDWTGVR